MTIPKHSSPGAMSPLDGRFSEAIGEAQLSLMATVKKFEQETGRTVDGIHLQWMDITTLGDAEPRHLRMAHLSWLPMPGEFE